jgi:hypothetical protein
MYQKSRADLLLPGDFFMFQSKGHKKTHLTESGELL